MAAHFFAWLRLFCIRVPSVTSPIISGLAGIGTCCASFGELLQGVLPQQGAFLVTLPIQQYSRAALNIGRSDVLSVTPAHKWKSLRLARAMLTRRSLPVVGMLRLTSDIPEGKGLASSTADLVATYRAIIECYALEASDTELHALLRDIEPSDGVMHEGIVAFLHQAVQLHAVLGDVPPLTLVAIDEGGQIDTLAQQRDALQDSVELQSHYQDLLTRMHFALRAGDLQAVGAISTRSAELNQRQLPKQHFARVLAIAKSVEAAGVVAAHSGTHLAVMLDACDPRHDEKQHRVVEMLSSLRERGQSVAVYHSLASSLSTHKVTVAS